MRLRDLYTDPVHRQDFLAGFGFASAVTGGQHAGVRPEQHWLFLQRLISKTRDYRPYLAANVGDAWRLGYRAGLLSAFGLDLEHGR